MLSLKLLEHHLKKKRNGDPDVPIIEVHTGLLEDHDWKLNLILIIVTIQLIIDFLTILRKQWKEAKSRNNCFNLIHKYNTAHNYNNSIH